MPDQNEHAIEGWKEIAKMFNVSVRTISKYRQELQDGGFIFYRFSGPPPRRTVCAFPSSLKRWIAIKSSKGEML